MTATLERPLRARAGLRAMIYRLSVRANRTPAHHPLRLHLEEQLADLKSQLTEVEQYIGAFSPPKRSKLTAAMEMAISDSPPATQAASVAQSDAGYARVNEPCSGLTASEKHERSEPIHISSASLAAQYRLMAIRSLHRVGVLAAHATAGSSSALQRMLDTVGESIIEFAGITLRAGSRVEGRAHECVSYCGNVAARNYRQIVILTQQGAAGSSRLVRQAAEISVENGRKCRAFVSRTLSRSSDHLGVLLGSCLVATANLRRFAGAGMRQCGTASVSFLHRSTQMAVAASMKFRCSARQTLMRTSDRIGGLLGRCHIATDQGVRLASSAAMQGFAAARDLLLRKVGQPTSRWAGSLTRVVVFRVADGASAATGAGRRAAERAGAEAVRRIIAYRLFLQKVIAGAPSKGREISTFCRRIPLRISDCTQKALATFNPVATQALRNARSAGLRSVAECRQIAAESLKTARAKWTVLSRHAARAGAAMRRRAAPKIQQVSVQAKVSIAAGRLFLQRLMIAAHSMGGEMSTFHRRVSFRISDFIQRSARPLPSFRDAGLVAQDVEPKFRGGTRIAGDGGNAS
jgi:hypothetical protein